jgi:hypothetical protein
MTIRFPLRKVGAAGAAVAAVGALVAGQAQLGQAAVVPGTPANDVHVGPDNDNAANRFIQPAGVAAKQHMDNTDLLFGRDGHDLLIGNRGADTLLGGRGEDILVGGPERGQAPNSDVLVGDEGNDINIWAPGDGSEVFAGQEGYDTMVFAPFVTNANGSLKLVKHAGRKIPRVDIGGKPQFTCQIVRVPARQKLGVQFLVRFLVNDKITVTVRQKDVERLLCPSPKAGNARVADLTAARPALRDVPFKRIPGVLGAIVAKP